jgi:hypothetical protein
MKRLTEFLIAMYVAILATCPLSICQVIPVKSLEQGNAFLYRSTGWTMGGGSWDYNVSLTVLGDTMVFNNKTFHRLSSGRWEHSDSTVLSTIYNGVEELICDFRWSVGDTVNLGSISWVVIEKGISSIFSDTQPYIRMTYNYGYHGERTIFKRFGVTYEYQTVLFHWFADYLLGARINGVLYGSPPTSVAAKEETTSETFVGIFPNPASRALSVQIKVQEPSDLKIDVYNILGQRVGRVYDGVVTNGVSVIRWNNIEVEGSTLPSGVYFVRLQINNRTFSRRILIVQ